MHRTFWLLLALVSSASQVALPAQDMIVVEWTGAVRALDSFTGASTPIGNGLFGQNAIARDSLGNLWSTHRIGTSTYALTSIDPATGAATIVANNFVDLRAMTDAGNGLLLAIQDANPTDRLVLLDPANAVVVPIGPLGFNAVQSLAFAGGNLWAWDLQAGLLAVDPTTGAATDVAPSVGAVVDVQWLSERADGRLVGGRTAVHLIDTATGLGTLIGGSFGDMRGGTRYFPYARSIGAGCAGTFGTVVASANVTAGPTATLTLQSTNHAPNAPAAIIAGLSNVSSGGVPLPLSIDPFFGTSGCSLQVSLDVSVPAVTSATGPATLSLQLPVFPSWRGGVLFVQHVVLEPVPGGLSVSNGVAVQFGF